MISIYIVLLIQHYNDRFRFATLRQLNITIDVQLSILPVYYI